jgi:hypothetical protein
MKRHRIILQLESELAQVIAGRADHAPAVNDQFFDNPSHVDGYWYGRQVGLAAALAYLKEKP